MASGLAAVLLACSCLLPLRAIASSNSKHQHLMRVESKPETMVKVKKHKEKEDYSMFDFTEGTEAANGCAAGSVPIQESEMCKFAGDMTGAGVTYTDTLFVLNPGAAVADGGGDRFEWEFVQGCYKVDCPADVVTAAGATAPKDGQCYFFNPQDGVPAPDGCAPPPPNGNGPEDRSACKLKGTPVCKRPAVALADATTKACPDGYEVVDDRAVCEIVIKPLELTLAHFFDVADHAQVVGHPKGCFAGSGDDGEGKAFFNTGVLCDATKAALATNAIACTTAGAGCTFAAGAAGATGTCDAPAAAASADLVGTSICKVTDTLFLDPPWSDSTKLSDHKVKGDAVKAAVVAKKAGKADPGTAVVSPSTN